MTIKYDTFSVVPVCPVSPVSGCSGLAAMLLLSSGLRAACGQWLRSHWPLTFKCKEREGETEQRPGFCSRYRQHVTETCSYRFCAPSIKLNNIFIFIYSLIYKMLCTSAMLADGKSDILSVSSSRTPAPDERELWLSPGCVFSRSIKLTMRKIILFHVETEYVLSY